MTGTVITAWSAVSAFGIGAGAFRAGLRAGRPAATSEAVPAPGMRACLIPDFDPRAVLGRKGTRSMDRVTALSVAVVGDLAGRLRAPGTALVLGTAGSVQSTMDFTRSSLTGDRPFYVDPAKFPNTVMNCAAGQCAIWHHLDGPNATISGGHTAGLLALNYARRLQNSGRAGAVLCGGAEEYSEARAWLRHHSAHRSKHSESDDEPDGMVIGEGAAMLLLEPAGSAPAARDGIAEVAAVDMAVFGQVGDIRPALVSCLRRALDRAGAQPQDVWLVAPGGARGDLGRCEQAALTEVFGDRDCAPGRICCAELIGDVESAAGTFGVLAALAAAEGDPAAGGRLALVTALDRDGTLGCALLRLRPRPAGRPELPELPG